jgi:hypothetical protein
MQFRRTGSHHRAETIARYRQGATKGTQPEAERYAMRDPDCLWPSLKVWIGWLSRGGFDTPATEVVEEISSPGTKETGAT